jgi:hypothetical protein
MTHVEGDSGFVLRDAGQIVVSPYGTVASIHGPRLQFWGRKILLP